MSETKRELPELMGTAETAAFLRVSSSRVGQLRARPEFPAPAYDKLSCGTLWLAEDIRMFEKSWDRSPRGGRPRKKPPAPAVTASPTGQAGYSHNPDYGVFPPADRKSLMLTRFTLVLDADLGDAINHYDSNMTEQKHIGDAMAAGELTSGQAVVAEFGNGDIVRGILVSLAAQPAPEGVTISV